MTDDGVTEIYGLAREAFAGGQRSFQVQAFPFRMTPENMARHRSNPNIAFWRNLKEGSDHFEATRQPPKLATCGGRYVFNPAGDASAFVPGAPCPAYQTDAEVAPLVAARSERDQARIAELSGNLPAMSYALMDGGMHQSFRKLLRNIGPERMQSMVAGKVEISQPQAALADPYGAGGDDEPQQASATGSILSR